MSRSDRRGTPRVRVSARAEYASHAGRVEGEVYDLGLGGVFIRAESPLQPGCAVTVRIEIPGEETPVRAEGHVVWANLVETGPLPAGMGVRFSDIPPADRSRLDRTLRALG